MTNGNKWLMARGSLRHHAHVVVLLQNAVAVLSIGLLILMNALRVERIDGRQAAFYVWDALVLVLQCWANFAALQHLPVAAIDCGGFDGRSAA